MKLISSSDKETRKIGKILAEESLSDVVTSVRESALVLALEGDLGAGKTTFVKGFAEGLDLERKITSPTFVILKQYQLKTGGLFYHIDCYRLSQSDDLSDLGFKEIISDSSNIVLIEWAEKVRRILPENTIRIDFDHLEENKRELTIGTYEETDFN